jgi:hypothetical protein
LDPPPDSLEAIRDQFIKHTGGTGQRRASLVAEWIRTFTGNVDSWDFTVTDRLAEREVILFNNAGVGSSRLELITQ